jgi:putative ABC transport system substrate-binding protein
VRRQVAVIFAGQSTPAALAAKGATATIPIVFTVGVDPVKFGLVASFDHPGGNASGVNFLTSELVGKQFEIIRELVPNSSSIGLLVNPDNPFAEGTTRDAREAARIWERKIIVVRANSEQGLNVAFETLVQETAGAVLVPGDGFYYTGRDKLVALAARHQLPAVYAQREFVDDGGLMNYGANIGDANRIAGGYVGRILHGDKPADLPVQQTTRIEMVINMKTAKALGLVIPETLLVRADEVIE